LKQDTVKASSQLQHLESLVAHSLDELQRLIADLRPSHLDDLGLPAALRWYAGELESHSDLKVQVNVEGDPQPISAPVKTALFRVTQEALVNAVKHADAESVTVKLSFNDRQVQLIVEDDGQGFDVAKVTGSGRKSWGLMGMEERAHLFGGDFRLEAKEGQGTRVVVSMPNNHIEVDNDDSTVPG
jgi:two-component system sensor histidine kinase DegS